MREGGREKCFNISNKSFNDLQFEIDDSLIHPFVHSFILRWFQEKKETAQHHNVVVG